MIVRNDLDGVLLFDKKTGLNVLLDENKPSKVDLAPRHVSIALTENCNLMCNQCYINHSSRSLNYEDVISWTDALYENGCLSIGLGGGEPTLWYKCLDIVSYINTTQMAVTLTTNGSASVDFYCKLLHKASVVRQWVQKNKDCLPLCGSYSCLGFLQEDVLPTQNFELKQQHYYFLHINAKKQLMRNVFDKQSIDIGENFIKSLQTYRRS